MKSAMRAALFLVFLFAIPIVPFLWLGHSFEQSLLEALQERSSSVVMASWVGGLLAADIFLPVPSIAVMTYAGGSLGVGLGSFVSWVGLSFGAVIGFALSRLFGYALVRRFSEPDDIQKMSTFTRHHGVAALVATRALPILGEVCVLLLGASRQSWRQFLPPLLLSNALLALTYATCGAYFKGTSAFPVAIVASGALPLLAALLIRRWWKTRVNEVQFHHGEHGGTTEKHGE